MKRGIQKKSVSRQMWF